MQLEYIGAFEILLRVIARFTDAESAPGAARVGGTPLHARSSSTTSAHDGRLALRAMPMLRVEETCVFAMTVLPWDARPSCDVGVCPR